MFLTAHFDKLRAVKGQKDPLVLEVVLKNNEEEERLASISVKIPFSLGFDQAGLFREARKKVGYLKPGERVIVPINIYCKQNIEEGVYPIEVKAITHSENYLKVIKVVMHNTSLRVIQR